MDSLIKKEKRKMPKLKVEEYKKTIFDILVKIDSICRENGINYYLCYGSLLGAVRHRDFIPWDDDIDIMMFRKDYYRLADYIIAHPELKLNYIDRYNREDTIFYCAKVCDAKTVVRESTFIPIKGYGAFVDIFPLDYLPENRIKRKLYMKNALFWEKVVQHSSRVFRKEKDLRGNILCCFNMIMRKLFNPAKILQRMHYKFLRFDKTPTKYIGIPWICEVFESSWFENGIEVCFGGKMFYAPAEYDSVLKTSYGDYMKLPPESEREYRHDIECFLLE